MNVICIILALNDIRSSNDWMNINEYFYELNKQPNEQLVGKWWMKQNDSLNRN